MGAVHGKGLRILEKGLWLRVALMVLTGSTATSFQIPLSIMIGGTWEESLIGSIVEIFCLLSHPILTGVGQTTFDTSLTRPLIT